MKLEIRRLTGADAEAHAWRYCVLMGQLTDVGCVTDTMRSTYFSLSMDRGVRVFGIQRQVRLLQKKMESRRREPRSRKLQARVKVSPANLDRPQQRRTSRFNNSPLLRQRGPELK
jgi:hypothetical protein